MKSSHGFTIVEVMIVIIVIAILSTVSVVIFNSTQVQTRDTKRSADISILNSYFEKYYEANGIYPRSDTTTNYNTGGLLVNQTTTRAQLQTIAPKGTDTLGDPRSNTPTNAFISPLVSGWGYTYTGGLQATSSVIATSFTFATHDAISCTGQMTADPSIESGASNYVLAYYNEGSSKIYLFVGKHGPRPTFNTNSNCIVQYA